MAVPRLDIITLRCATDHTVRQHVFATVLRCGIEFGGHSTQEGEMRISTRAAILVVLAATLLDACNSGGGRQGPARRQAEQYAQGIGGPGRGVRPGPSANEAYIAGLDLRKQGNCKGAVDVLRGVANLGPGYEGAQFALGDCLSGLAAGANAPEYHEAVMWLLRAADGGWTEAQGRLAELYAVGPESVRDKAEAAYWLALYKLGAELPRFGFEAMPVDRVRAIDAVLPPADRDAGRARAAQWQKKAWIPPKASPVAREPGSGPVPGGREIRRGPRGEEGLPPN